MPSLACNYVFHSPKHNAKGRPHRIEFEVLEMQKWNITTIRVQRVDEKREVICLVIMLTPKVMVVKMLKMAHFCTFCW